MTVKNPSNLWRGLPPNGPSDYPYVPSSYQLYSLLVDSEGTSFDMHGVDVVSGTQATFSYTCASGHNAAITRVNINIKDGSITPSKFAGLTAFDNGCLVQHLDANVGSREVIKDFLDGFTIKNNTGWTVLVGIDGSSIIASAGDDQLPIRWSIFRCGSPLHLKDGEQFSITFQDSTTGITEMCAMVQGLVYPNQ